MNGSGSKVGGQDVRVAAFQDNDAEWMQVRAVVAFRRFAETTMDLGLCPDRFGLT